jgi:O-antigen/teichoic acid export membrane protein
MVKPSLHWQTLRPLANGISQALRLALPVLFLPFVARVLGPEETGRYLVYMQVSVWLAVVADAGFSLYFIEFAATAKDERETHRFFWTDYFARLAMYALVGLGALGVAYLAGSDLPILAVSIVTGWVLGSGLSVLRHFRGSVTAIAFGDLVTTVIYGVAITAFLPSAPTAVAAFSTFVGSLLMGMLVHMLWLLWAP